MNLETAVTTPAAATAQAATPSMPLTPLPIGWSSLGSALVQTARAHGKKLAIVDSLGTSLTYGDMLLRCLVLGRVLERELSDCRYVGLLVPPTAPAAVANLALTIQGRIPVNLNYTTGQEVLDSSVDQCRMTHVITSKRALDKFPARPKTELILLEDIPRKVRTSDKIWAAALARGLPLSLLRALLPGLRAGRLDQPATVIFTSGSTGQPKGVVLTHGNILTNVHQIDSHVNLTPDEVILGILPFFHSFGFTVTLWTSLLLGKTSVFHTDPTKARIIGNLVKEHRVTMLAASPTFMRFYLRDCSPEQFATIRLPILGAEKLYPEMESLIRAKLGVIPLEGYGCTETGPVVAVNTPDPLTLPDGRRVDGNRPGTVGRPVPGTSIRIVHLDTGEALATNQEGHIHVKGPQVMPGYMNEPEKTAEVLRDGWYATGDLGFLDADGFLTVTGRIKRFSKVAGEMVPHERVEAAILRVLEDEEPHVAVTSVPCNRRGERLIVLHTEMNLTPEQICRRLNESPLPKLWLPSPGDFIQISELPILGSGKLDLRALKQLAENRVSLES